MNSKLKGILLVLSAGWSSCALLLVLSASNTPAAQSAESAPPVALSVGKVLNLSLSGDYRSHTMADGRLAEVSVVGSRQLHVRGKTAGTTELTVIDQNGGQMRFVLVIGASASGRVDQNASARLTPSQPSNHGSERFAEPDSLIVADKFSGARFVTVAQPAAGGAAKSKGKAPAPTAGKGKQPPTRPGAGGVLPPPPPPTPPPVGIEATGTPEAPGTTVTPTRTPVGASATNGPLDPNTKKISMTFDKADISQVLKFFGKAANITFVWDDTVTGQVNIASNMDVSLAEGFEILKAVLQTRGFAVEGTLKDRVIKVMLIRRAITEGPPFRNGQPMEPGDQIVTQIIHLNYIDAARVRTDLQTMVAQDRGSMTANTETNTIIITDSSRNVKRIMDVVKELDKDHSDTLSVEFFLLKNAYAPAVAQTLQNLFNPSAAQRGGAGGAGAAGAVRITGGGPGGPGGGGFPGAGGVPGAGGPGVPGAPGAAGGSAQGPSTQETKSQVVISSDERTNSVIVSAAKERMPLIDDLIKKLDVNVAPELVAETVLLKYADATLVADSLNQIFQQPQGGPRGRTTTGGGFGPFGGFGGGFGGASSTTTSSGGRDMMAARGYASYRENVVVPDVRTNSLIITANKENLAAFKDMIKTLDVETTYSELTKLYRLKYAKADELATTLNNVFRQQGGGGAGGGGFFGAFFQQQQASQQNAPLQQLRQVTVVANVKDNSLLVSGPLGTQKMVSELIAQLDRIVPQVYIEVLIADVTLNRDEKMGFQFNWQIPGVTNIGTDLGINSGNDLSSTVAGGVPGFRYSVITRNFNSVLRALASRSDVKVLSKPRITVMDNTQGIITVGQLFPFVTSIGQTTTGQTPAFENISIGITLTVTPHVNPDDQILMDVRQQINDILSTVNQGGFTQPVQSNRDARTTVQVLSGETIVIGGIIQDRDEVRERKIPLLGDLPLLKYVFRDKFKAKVRTELLVFITPRVVRTDEEIRKLTEQQKSEQTNDTLAPGLSLDARKLPKPPQPEKK